MILFYITLLLHSHDIFIKYQSFLSKLKNYFGELLNKRYSTKPSLAD